MSTRADLHQTLLTRKLTPDSVVELAAVAEGIWLKSPSVEAFTAWGIFRLLVNRWDDNQSVPSGEFDEFDRRLVPKLDEWLRSDASFSDLGMVTDTIAVLHNCWK